MPVRGFKGILTCGPLQYPVDASSASAVTYREEIDRVGRSFSAELLLGLAGEARDFIGKNTTVGSPIARVTAIINSLLGARHFHNSSSAFFVADAEQLDNNLANISAY